MTANNESIAIESSSPPLATPSKEPQSTAALRSLSRITLAGVGGALAGLSVARRRGTFGASTDAVLGQLVGDVARETLRPSLRLPMTWAIGCTTFVGIIEFSSLVSPTSLLLVALREMGVSGSGNSAYGGDLGDRAVDSKQSDSNYFFWDEKSTQTLGDFVLGGAIAGAIFKGNSISATLPKNDGVSAGGASSKIVSSMANNKICSAGSYKQKKTIGRGRVIRPTTKYDAKPKAKISPIQLQSLVGGARILKSRSRGDSGMVPPTLKPRTGIMAGLFPGLALGLVAGLIQISLNRLDATIIEMESKKQSEEEREGMDNPGERPIPIEEDIDDKVFEARVKEMTTAEIQREIDALRERSAS